jgi:hypothetical protein
VTSVVKQVKFAGKVERQEPKAGERQARVPTGEAPESISKLEDVGLGAYRPI